MIEYDDRSLAMIVWSVGKLKIKENDLLKKIQDNIKDTNI